MAVVQAISAAGAAGIFADFPCGERNAPSFEIRRKVFFRGSELRFIGGWTPGESAVARNENASIGFRMDDKRSILRCGKTLHLRACKRRADFGPRFHPVASHVSSA